MVPFDPAPLFAQEAASEETHPWLIIFADLVSLLTTFFVLLFALSHVSDGKWKTLVHTLSRRETPMEREMPARPAADRNMGGPVAEEGLDLGYLGTLLGRQLKDNPLLQATIIYRLGDRLVFSLPSDVLFARGSAEVEGKGAKALFELGGVLRNIANEATIVGHTDPAPVAGSAFASNWELSLARATAVADVLRRSGYTRDLAAFGVSDTRFGEITKDLPLQRRLELARRVDVIVTTAKDF
ncbi:MAG: flagellar motor protein MotB [Alphaproteobacteria bacterium]